MTYRKVDFCARRSGIAWFSRLLGLAFLSALVAGSAWGQVRELVVSEERVFVNEGGNNSFTVALRSEPTGNVTVTVEQPSNTDVKVDTDSGTNGEQTEITFSASDWNTAKTVTVSAGQDSDSPVANDYAIIVIKATGGGYDRTVTAPNNTSHTLPAYGRVYVTVVDDDRNAVMLSANSLVVNEGSTKSFTARLTSQPTGNVTVSLSPIFYGGDPAFITLDKTSLTFTSSDWDDFQTVTVSGVQDNIKTNPRGATIAVRATGGYGSQNISVSAIDDDSPSLTLSTDELSTTEGSSASFTVSLTVQPTAPVQVSLRLCKQGSGAGQQSCGDASSWATISPARLTFNSSNYDTGQAVTVTAVEDADAGDESGLFIDMTANGGEYVGVTGSIKVTVADNDTRALVVSPDSGLSVARGAGSRLGIRLATQPTGNVSVGITKSGTHSADVTWDKFAAIFTPSNWNQTQYLTVFVDSTVDASQFSATIELSAAGADYNLVSISKSIAVTLVGNAFTLSSSSLSLDEGEDDTFTVRLATKPHEDVTVTLAQPSNPGVRVDTNTSVTGYQNALTFTPDNWDTTQTVTVYALQDDDADDIILEDEDADDITLRPISITASGGGYGRATGSVSVSVDDDETYSLDVSETSLSLTEGGSAGTFTVALTAKPNRAASFRLVTSDTSGAITATPSTLTFSLSNYGTPQTVTVSPGQDPDAQDDSETISINPVVFANAIEPGSYDNATASVSVNVTDDDSPGLMLPPSRLLLDEGGGAKTFEVSLATLPAADVTVSLTSGDTGAVTVSPASLTFVLQDYYTRVESSVKKGEYVNVFTPVVHTVTVTPVEDSDSVDESVQIFFTASDGGYDDVTGSVAVSVNDDELRKLELPTTSVLLRKGGHPDTFKVGLRARPSGNVTVSLVSSDTSVATVSPASMTFTPSNYNFQTATVATTKAANSADETASINLSATGGGYDRATGSVTVSVGDLGFELSKVNLSLTEGGSAGSFTVKLATEPTANVTVSLASSNSAAARVSPASLTFTPSNYSTTQTVTVTPVQDDNLGDKSLSISLTSSGGGYGSVTGSVSVAVGDDDDRGLNLSSNSLSINEGRTGTFTVKLNTRPPLPPSPTTVPIIGGGSARPGSLSSDVTVSLVSSDTSNVTVSPSSLTFTRSNYNSAQTVTVTTVEDSDSYSENANINLVATGIGSYFTGTVAVSVVDDSTGFDFSSTSLMLTERGTGTFTVTLNEQQPQSDVAVLLLSSDTSSIRVSPSEMKFTPSNYRQPQTVTVTAMEDGDSDDENVNISFLASGGNYDDATGRVAVSVADDDIPVLDISRTSLRVIEQATGTFSVKLRVAPSQNVTVSLASDDTSSVTVSPSSLTFTSSNYGTVQAVTVTAVDDVDLNSESVNIDISASGGGYGDATGEVAVSVVDNDAAVFDLSAAKLRVAERNTDSFTVKLRQPPSDGVTVSLASSDTSSVTVSPSSLTFTALNYDTEQTVTVAAIEDRNSSGENVSIDISASGGGYDDVTGTVRVITEDNDVRDGYFTIHTPSSKKVSLTEGDRNAAVVSFSLGANPDENVIISLRSSDESIVRVTPSSMSYGADSSRHRRFYLTLAGQDEDIMDEKVTIYMSASGDRHSGATETIEVTVVDDDRLGLELSQLSLSVNEGGSPGTFSVALTEVAAEKVKVSVTSSNTAAATVAPAELIFNPSNYAQPRTVTVTPVDDSNPLDESVEISLTSMVELQGPCSDPPVQTDPGECSSPFSRFNGVPVRFPVTVIDDDRFGLDLSKTSLSINEGGSPDTFMVALDSQPSADVTVSPTSSDTGAATVPSASLTFTASNYDTAQMVSVSAVDDDDIADEDVNISFSVSGGGFEQDDLDRIFGDLSVSVSVDDGDTGSLDLSATSLQLSEGGAAGTFEVKLAASPTGRVTVAVEGNHGDAVTISPSTLNFTASNYDTNRTITVTPMDDADLNDENVDIILSASGGGYDDVSGRVAVTVEDDGVGALEVSANSLELIEGSGVDGTFTVKLTAPPLGNVAVDLASEDDNAATVSPSRLTFTRSNYDTAQTVTVTPEADADLRNENLEITLSASGGGYDDVEDSVTVSVDDDSTLGLELSVDSLSLEEGGTDGTFTVRLTIQPTDDVVTVDLASEDVGAATVSPSRLIFSRLNYNAVQTVTVAPVGDADLRDENLDITLSASGGGYDDVRSSVAVSVDDDNSLGLKLSANSLSLDEGGDDGTFTVRLTRQPTGNVRVSLTSDDTGAATVSPSQLTFTQANYDTVQTVTVAPVDDADLDDEDVDITLSVSGGGYDDAGGTVDVSVDDNSGPGLELSVNSLWLEEDGADGTFTVRLTVPPTGNVTVDLASNNTGAATVSPAQLTFTQANYDMVKTVTVTPEVDADLRDENLEITLSASGGGYGDVEDSVDVSVDDDNSLGLKLSANSLSLDEGGGYGTFTVRLTRQPTGNVTVDLASGDTGAATVDSSQLTFTTSNYETPQKVKVEPVDDADLNDEDVDITLSVTGGGYDSAGGTVQVSVADDDRTPSYLRYSPSTAKHLNLSETVTEQGKEVADSGTLGVRLSRRPSGTVTLTVTQVSPANKILEFDADLNTAGNQNTVSIRAYSWRVPKAMKVFTLSDLNLREDSAVVRVTATGGGYNGQTLDYSVTIEDTGGTLGILTNPVSSLDLNERESGTIRFKLSDRPPTDATTVVMEISTSDDSISIRGASQAGTLQRRIDPADWDSYQDVVIDAVRDLDTDDETAQVTFRVASGGGAGVSWQSKTVTVNVTDDAPNDLLVSAKDLTIREGLTEQFDVRLTSAPGAGNTITVAVAPDSGSDLTVDKSSLTFSNDNWSDTQTVTVTAGQDIDAVNDNSDITLTASGTSDYSGKTATVKVTVRDDDDPVLLPSDTSVSIDEGGSAGTFTVMLSSPPTDTVTVGVLSRDIGIARVSPASLTFDSSSWNTAQTVSVTAVEDDDFDNEKATISLTASGDADYAGLTASVSVSVADDDSYFLEFSDDTLSLNEGGTGSFTVALGARPLGDVTVTLVQPSNTKVTLDTDRDADGSQTTLNFLQSSWNVAQNVYVKAALDSDSDDETATISMTATGGGYGLYEVKGSVEVSVVDNGALALTVGSYERALSEGQTYMVDIRLASQPEGDVTVAAVSSDPSAVAITDPASGELTFTTTNWSTDQTLSFQAVEDGDAVNERVVISMSVAGTEYSFSRSLVVTTRDNDKVELVLSKTELTTVEGVAGTFTVKLGSQPTGTVTVTPSFEAFFDGTVDATLDADTTRAGNQSTLTFTKINWNTARTVAVTPNADDDAQDEQFYVNVSASGANYGHQFGEVTVTVTDDDARSILVSDTSLLLNEGGTATFSLSLARQPSAGQRKSPTVNIHVGPGTGYFKLTSATDTDDNTENDVILQFTDDNWDTAQTVTVSAPQDDNLYEERGTIYITAGGGDHTDIKAERVRLRVLETNYKESQIGVKEINRGAASDFIVVAEGTATNTFDVSLKSQPTQNVRVTLTSVLTLDKTTLNFVPGNYNTAQTVTITPFDDTRRPATENFDVTLQSATTPAVTGADEYRATRVFSVEVTRDNSNTTSTELTVARPHLVVTAGSQSNVFMVALSAAPTSDVEVGMNMSKEDFKIATATPRFLTFTDANWQTPQAVTVTSSTSTTRTSVDVILNGKSRVPVSQGAIDPNKMTRTVTVTLEAADRDLRAIGLNLSKPSLQVTEGGTPGTFDIKLTNTYSSSLLGVQIDITSADTKVATVSTPRLNFTSSNWDTPQTVTIAAVEDADMDDERVALELVGSTTFPPPDEKSSEPQKEPVEFISYTYTVSVVDDDDSGFVLSPRTLTLTEGGSTGSFTVALATEPREDVTVSVASLAPNAATVSTSSLTFTQANYSTAQSVTVTPVDDVDIENETFNIVVSAADGGYDGDTDTVAVTVEDDDAAGFTLSTKALTVREGSTGVFTVALRNEPTGTVTVTLSQPDNDDVTLDTNLSASNNQNTLTFDKNDWNVGKTVTVSAAHDDDSGNEDRLTVNLSASGGGYNSATDSMTISVTDDDPPGLVVSVTSLTIEEGMEDTFTVALATEPQGNVTVTLTQPTNTDIKADTDAATPGSNETTLDFGLDDWSTPQTVTVRVRKDQDSEPDTGGISMSASGGDYDSAATTTVLVQVTDIDKPGLTLSASELEIREGESQTFDVSLSVDPKGPVTVTLAQPSNSDVTLDTDDSDTGNQNTLEFTESTWDIPQTVTVSAIADADAVDDTATISISALNSGYGDVTGTVTVEVTDPQVQGLELSESPLSILEGQSKTVTLKLLTQPTEDVTVTLAQPSDAENTYLTLDTNATDDGDQNTLTFTTDNWNTTQDVVFTAAVDQDLDTGRATVNITASGGDYDDLDDTTLSITLIDKDAPRLLVSQSALSLSEGGTAGSFTVTLSLLPTAAVTVSISAGADADLLQITPADLELDFTTDNWDQPQTVSISAVQDTDATDEDITVSLTAAGGNYAGVDEDVAVTVDDDEAELVVSAETLSVAEGGASGEFTVALSSRPTATVMLSLTAAPSDALEVDTDPDTAGPQTTLTFTQDDWGTARTVQVTAIEDTDMDEEEVTLTLAATGGDYAGVSKNVAVSVTENDIPKINLTKTSLALCEDQNPADNDRKRCDNPESDSFMVSLSLAPDQQTVVSVTSSDTGAAEVTEGASLTFTPNDWNTPQPVTITRVEDSDAVDESVTVTLKVETTGGNFVDVEATVAVSVVDSSSAGLTLSPTSLTMDEGSTSGTFTVQLATRPGSEVTVTLAQPTNTDVTVDTDTGTADNQTELTFNADNWNRPQTVTVSAAEDQDGDQDEATISLSASGGDYAGVNATLKVTVNDNDTPNLMLSGNALGIDEGSTGTFTVKLTTQPVGGNVTVAITSADVDAATVSAASLTFTSDNWNVAQSITVTGVQDDDAENEEVTVTLSASGADYDDVDDAEVTVTVTDDETVEMRLSEASLTLTEGQDGEFTVVLASAPTGEVTVSITSSDTDVASPTPASLTFDSTDWNTARTVTITASDDSDTDDEQGTITVSASGGDYGNQEKTVAVVVWDDDRTAGLILSATGPLNLEEDAASDSNSASFMVKLASPPVGDDAVVSVTNPDAGAVSASASSLTFTPSNWNVNQSLTIDAVQDDDAQDEDVTVTLSPSGGGYGSAQASTLRVMVDDDESVELRLSAYSVELEEGNSVELTVTMASQPTADVTVTFANPGPAFLAVDADSFTNGVQAGMTFTTDNWNTPQKVSIIAIEDNDLEDHTTTVTYTVAGGDYAGYCQVPDRDPKCEISVKVTDNDKAAEERDGATQVLAAVARATLAGSLDVISRRFDASAGARRVQFGGRDVALDRSGIDDLVGHFTQMARTREELHLRSNRYGGDLFGVDRQSTEWLGSIPLREGRPAFAQPNAGGFSSDMQMLGSFTYALTSSADSDGSSTATSSLWGSSEQREFSGTVQQVPYEGSQSAVWLGYDQRTENGWLYGVAASRSSGEADYKIRNRSARLETQLRTYMPYLEITGESGASVRIVYGFGIGEVKVQEISSNEGTAKLTMDMTSVGGRWPFLQIGIGGTLSATGSIASSRMTTGSSASTASISELNVDSQQMRAGLELAHSGFGSGIRWAPRFGVSVRQDEGDGITGSGVEVTAAMQMTTPGSRFSLDLNGHWLTSHSAEDEASDEAGAQAVREEDQVELDEWGMSLTLRVASSDEVGRGFSMSLGPEWGAQRSDLLDREEAFNLDQHELQRMRQSAQRMMLATRLGYGMDAFGGLLTPFAEYHLSGGSYASSRLTSGVKFMGSGSFEARIFGEQRTTQGREPESKIGVEMRQYLF